jgi:serine protease AprX
MKDQWTKRPKKDQCESATWGGGKLHLLLLLLLLTVAQAFGQSGQLSPDLASIGPSARVNMIVQYKVTPTATNTSLATSVGATSNSQGNDNSQGGNDNSQGDENGWSQVKQAAYVMSPSQAQQLTNVDSTVTYISPDRPLQSTATGNSSLTLDYYDTTVNAQIGWQLGYTGTGIGVAVIDSGMMTGLPDFSNRVVYSQSFVSGDSGTADKFGHGTHVAGIIGGNGKQSTGSSYTYTFKGIAPNVNLINLRVLDKNGVGTDSAVISAINWAINNKTKYNIRVINLSLGRPVYESYKLDPLCQAVEKAWNAGIVVVVAAGNEGRNNSANTNGYGTITAPGNDPYVVTVGAMNTVGTSSRGDDKIASYSSKGPTLYDHLVKPDIVAPGNRINSLYAAGLTLPNTYPGNEIPNSLYVVNGNSTSSSVYYQLSGTSMAAPMVSGTVALMLQKNSALTPDQVKARLMKSAYKVFPPYSTATDLVTGTTYTSQSDIFTVGAGYLDVQAVLASTDLAPSTSGSAQSPAVALDASGNVVLVNGSSVVWGNSVLWGTSVVWGTSVLWGTNVSGQSVLWGSSVCWGASTTQGYSVLWGSSVVWGTTSTDASEATAISINGEK